VSAHRNAESVFFSANENVNRRRLLLYQDVVHHKTVLHWAVEHVPTVGNVNLVRFLLDTQAAYSDRMADKAFSSATFTGRGVGNCDANRTGERKQAATSSSVAAAINQWSGRNRDTILHVVAAADGEDDNDDDESGSSSSIGGGRSNSDYVPLAKSDRVKDRRALRLELVNLLLSRGADTSAINAVGCTPAQLARRPEVGLGVHVRPSRRGFRIGRACSRAYPHAGMRGKAAPQAFCIQTLYDRHRTLTYLRTYYI
jgi:hypothetical protein